MNAMRAIIPGAPYTLRRHRDSRPNSKTVRVVERTANGRLRVCSPLNGKYFCVAEKQIDPSTTIELRSTSRSNVGVYAARDIALGEMVVQEAPLLTWRAPTKGRADPAWTPTAVEAARVLETSARQHTKTEWTALYAPPSLRWPTFEEAVEQRATLNAMADGTTAALFGTISRFNHSCRANCKFGWNKEENIGSVTTVWPVRRGEELHISYIPQALAHDDRAALLQHYDFVCSCPACTAPDQVACDAARKRLAWLTDPQHCRHLKHVDFTAEAVALMEDTRAVPVPLSHLARMYLHMFNKECYRTHGFAVTPRARYYLAAYLALAKQHLPDSPYLGYIYELEKIDQSIKGCGSPEEQDLFFKTYMRGKDAPISLVVSWKHRWEHLRD